MTQPQTSIPPPPFFRLGRRSLFLHSLLLLLTLILYASTLTFPAFYDTLLNTQLADDLTLLTVWLPNERFGFYRPLVFLPAVLMNTFGGGYSPILGHLYNLINQLLNVFLLTHLAHRLWQIPRKTLTAGLLFATFPFAYQSLAIHGNAAYLTVTAVILLALHSYLSYDGPRPTHIIPLFLVAILTNESGVLLIPILLLFALTRSPQQSWQHPTFWRKHGWLLLCLLFYLILYLFLPRGGGPQLDYGGNDPWIKGLIILQTAVSPLASFASYIPISGQSVILTSTVLLLFALITATWFDPSRLRPFLFTFGWWLGASLLIAITLPTYYIADGARLLYLGAGGLALGWAALLEALWSETHRWRQASWLIVLSVMTITHGRFSYSLIQTYKAVSTPFHIITDTMANQPAEDGLVIVNLPQWQAPIEPTYPLTSQFAPFMGDHLFAYELFRANTGTARPIYTLVVPELQSETPYPYALYQAFASEKLDQVESPRNHLFIYRYLENGPTVAYHGRIDRNYIPATTPDHLVKTTPYMVLDATARSCDQTATIELDITAMHNGEETARSTATFFVQLFTADWELIGQADGPPYQLPYGRIELWGSRLQDLRHIPIPIEKTAAHALIGTYDSLTGTRHPMTDSDNKPIADNALLLPIVNCSF